MCPIVLFLQELPSWPPLPWVQRYFPVLRWQFLSLFLFLYSVVVLLRCHHLCPCDFRGCGWYRWGPWFGWWKSCRIVWNLSFGRVVLTWLVRSLVRRWLLLFVQSLRRVLPRFWHRLEHDVMDRLEIVVNLLKKWAHDVMDRQAISQKYCSLSNPRFSSEYS